MDLINTQLIQNGFVGCCIVVITKWTYGLVSWCYTFRKHCQFVKFYPTDSSLGFLGVLPIFKQLIATDDAYHEYRLNLNRQTKEQTVAFRLGLTNGLMVADAKLAKFLLGLPPHILEKGGLFDETFRYDPNGFLGGLFEDEGKTWQIHRKSLSKLFHYLVLEHYIEDMDISAVEFTEQLCKNKKFLDTSEVLDKCNRLTFEVLCKCIMGDNNNNCQSVEVQPILTAMEHLGDMAVWGLHNVLLVKIVNLLPFGFGDKLLVRFAPTLINGLKAVKVRDRYIGDQIGCAKQRIANGEEVHDLTYLLIKDIHEQNASFTMAQVRANIYTFLFAGHETSSTTLQWALYFLGEHSEWSQRISDEFDTIGRTITGKTLKKIPVTDAFIKETLRVAHVVDQYLQRRIKEDVKLPDGKIMPKGLEYIIDIGPMMKNENVFSNSNLFNPERFLDNNMKDADPYWFIPFSAGRRNCIGYQFAMQQLKITILRLCSNVNIKNRILEQNEYGRPPHKMLGLTFKIKPNSLEQQFGYK